MFISHKIKLYIVRLKQVRKKLAKKQKHTGDSAAPPLFQQLTFQN